MEKYTDTWSGDYVCGTSTKNLKNQSPPGEPETVKLKIKISSQGGYSKSDGLWHTRFVETKKLFDFIAGFTVQPTGFDGSADDEIKVKVETSTGYAHFSFDNYLPDLHDDYLFWTNDGCYEDEGLMAILTKVSRKKTKASAEVYQQLLGNKNVMAMEIDRYWVTLFKRDLPIGFFEGLEAFQKISRCCETHLTKGVEE